MARKLGGHSGAVMLGWVIAIAENHAQGQQVIHVDADATGANNGSSWADGYIYLQNALAAAVSGDQIWVAAGTYKPDQGNSQTPGDPTATFQLRDGVAMYGHFLGTETTIAERNITDPADPLRKTILSGDIGGVGDPGDNTNNVVTAGGVSDTAVLDGFTIRDGWARLFIDSVNKQLGGGMYIGTGSPTISNCASTANNADAGGGAVHNSNGTPTLINSSFTGNFADFGGGMSNLYGNPVLIGCTFTGNEAGEKGGGMAEMFGNSTLTNCKFFDNFTVAYNGMGGGMYVHWYSGSFGNAMLANCLFSGNSSDHGGGMYAFGVATVANCTFSRNNATFDSGGFGALYMQSSLANCILWGNIVGSGTGTLEQEQLTGNLTIDHSCIRGWTGTFGGVDNTGGDPLFADSAAEDYHLSAGSSGIDAGDNAAVPPSVTTDLDGTPRVVNDIVDMGVYESQAGAPAIPTTSAWGILAMTLLLLTAGAIVLRQRRSL